MKKYSLLLLLVALFSFRAWADELPGEGSVDEPYLIQDQAAWNLFALNINSGTTYSGKIIKLDLPLNNPTVNVTEMIGSAEHEFQGVLLGNTRGVNITLTGTDDGCALFHTLRNASIKDLNISGTVSSAYPHAASLAVYAYETTEIEHCATTVTITDVSSTSGAKHHGGFIAISKSNDVSFTNCVFNGKLLGENARYCAGFVGDDTDAQDMSFSRCLFAPTEVTMNDNENESGTFAKHFYNGQSSNYLAHPCFYTQKFGYSNWAWQVSTDPQADFYKKEYTYTPFGTNTDIDYYSALECGFKNVNNVLYTGSEINYTGFSVYYVDKDGVILTKDTDYTVTITPSTVQEVGDYTITVTGKGYYHGSMSTTFKVLPTLNGSGTQDDPYEINSNADWNIFANNVNNGISYENQYIKLMDNITVTTMAGVFAWSDNNKKFFKGIFDGDGKTMTLNLESDDDYCAPFRVIGGNNAHIKNLNITGTVTSSGKYAAGLAGYLDINHAIENCVNTVTITSTYVGDANNGGFVGYSDGYASYKNCVFAGKLLGASATSNAGFTGANWNNFPNVYTDCLFNPTEITMGVEGSKTFATSTGNNTYTRAYYTTAFGEPQGFRVSSETPNNQIYKQITACDNNNYYAYCDITNVNEKYVYSGSAVDVSPVVKFVGTTLTLDTDYEITFKDSDDQTVLPANLIEKGSYTMTISAKDGGGYSGSAVFAFDIIQGEDLDGYVFYTDTDTDGTFYVIANEADLELLAAYINSGHLASGKRFKQTADITMVGEHTAIGIYHSNDSGNTSYSKYHRFGGIYDGDNHIIKDLYINKTGTTSSDSYQGLFGYVFHSAIIRNVKLVDCNITGYQYVGGIAGRTLGNASISDNRVRIQNCQVIGGTINALAPGGYNAVKAVGGIVGYTENYTNISDCENSSDLSSNNNYCGGIVGWCHNYSNIQNCFNNGLVISNTNSNNGGIVGYTANTANISYCYYANPCIATQSVGNKTDTGMTYKVYSISAGENVGEITSTASKWTSAITGLTYYANNSGNYRTAITITPAPAAGHSFVKYISEQTEISNPMTADGTHDVFVNSEDIVISAITSVDSGIDMADVTVADIPERRYIDEEIIPVLSVTYNNNPLVEGTDYLVQFANNKSIGTADVTLSGINNYKGSVVKHFEIANFHGAGTEAEPFEIANEEDLRALAHNINNKVQYPNYQYYYNKFFKQTANITLTEEHTAIGLYKSDDNNRLYTFRGAYDGDNHTITNLTVNKTGTTDSDKYQGLFGCTYGARLTNIKLVNCDIKGYQYVGGIAGYIDRYTNDNTTAGISNCTVNGSIQGTKMVGGIVGYSNYSNVSDNINYASVQGEGEGGTNVGGIVGYRSNNTNFVFSDNFNAGAVTAGTDLTYVGSVGGRVQNLTGMTNNYYVPGLYKGMGDNNGTAGSDSNGKTDIVFTVTEGNAMTHIVQIDAATVVDNNTNYYLNGVKLTLSYDVPGGALFDRYTVNSGTISEPIYIFAEHTLTDVAANVIVEGSHVSHWDISDEAVAVNIPTVPYTGSVQTVNPMITRGVTTLVQGTDFTFTVNPATIQEAGEYTMTITGIGNYTGERVETFNVAEPTIIHDAAEWNTFATNINNGVGNTGYYKLADDFDNTETAVTKQVGTTEHPFSGTFDGNGKTLKVSYTNNTDYGAAPFKAIAGATIKNITITGSVEGRNFVGGLVGYVCDFDNTIENVIVSATVKVYCSGETHWGGIVGNSLTNTLHISDAVFNGAINSVYSNSIDYFGGLVGYSEGSTLAIDNCLVIVTSSFSRYYPVAIKSATAEMNCTVNDMYYTKDPTLTDANLTVGTGIKVYNAAQNDFCKKELTFNEVDYYSKEELVYYNFQNVVEYTGGQHYDVVPAVMYRNVMLTNNVDYSAVVDPEIVQEVGTYAITFTGAGDYAGTNTTSFIVAHIFQGEGTEENPYLISTLDDWNHFAENINTAHCTYEGQYIKVTANIGTPEEPVSVTAGTTNAGFMGNFDGGGKTITVDRALFTYVGNGCNIHDLHVAGDIETNAQYAGGIISYIAQGTSSNKKHITLTNCRSSVNIHSTYSGSCMSGGLIGFAHDHIIMTYENCIFDGSLSSSVGEFFGGFMSRIFDYSTITYNNCLMKGDVSGLTKVNGTNYTFGNVTNTSTLTLNNAYYTTPLSVVQGVMVSATLPESGIYKQVTAADQQDYYALCDINGIQRIYQYTGSVIAIEEVVTYGTTTFVKDTDYTVVIKDSNNTVVLPEDFINEGSYTVTVSAKEGSGFTGSTVFNVDILNGDNLDGYIFAKGTDDEGTYYKIANEDDLERLAAYVNSGHNASGLRFKQTANIVMANEHTAIGNNTSSNYRFQGTFDGANNTITGLTINKTTDQSSSNYQGLFGYIYNTAVVKNVILINCNITGRESTGGVVGYANGYSSSARCTITNCQVVGGAISSATGLTPSYHGGIAGNIYNTNLTNSENSATIGDGGNNHGGIVGYAGSTQILNCFNTGTVAGGSNLGAIAGSVGSFTITNNYYADPCTVRGLGNYEDQAGRTERVYTITPGDNVTSIAGTPVVTSTHTNKSYYKAGETTVTITANIPDGFNFIRYASEQVEISDPTTATGEHTLTVVDENIVISAILSNGGGIAMTDVTIADIPEKRWTNDAIIPVLDITYNNNALVEGTDYLVEYANNINIGTADVTITGVNDYTGTVVKHFTIADFAGQGTEEQPYQIATEEDLEALAHHVNTGLRTYEGLYLLQTADITMTAEHTAIGKTGAYFKGIYNGDNHNITNLTINKTGTTESDKYQGLFGYMYDGTAKNINLVNCDIKGYFYVGGISGEIWGTGNGIIENCTISGNIQSTANNGYSAGIAGYVGTSNSSYHTFIRNNTNYATITGQNYIAGIVGYSQGGQIENNFNAGAVVTTGTRNVANILAYNYSSNVLHYNYYACDFGEDMKGMGSSNNTTGYDSNNQTEKVYGITLGNQLTHVVSDSVGHYNNRDYYRNGVDIELSFDLPAGKLFDKYAVSDGTLTNPYSMDGTHQLSLTQNVTLTGSYVDKYDIADESVTITHDKIYGTGEVQTLNLLVQHVNDVLVKDVDYTLSPETVQTVGDHTITITGIGEHYTGTREYTVTVYGPTIISNRADWIAFAQNINAGNDLDGYYKLADDYTQEDNLNNWIDENHMAGTSAHPFKGLFDGNGKTMIIHIGYGGGGYTESNIGLFRYINGATIKNLNLTGSVVTTGQYMGGLVSNSTGNSTIENCVVSVMLYSSKTSSGYGYHGGIVAKNGTGTLTFTDCQFNGKMTANNSSITYNGGFVGNNSGNVVFNNCLFEPEQITMSTSSSGTFTRNGNATYNGAYYTQQFGTAQGLRVYAGAQETFCHKEVTFGTTDYYAIGTTAVNINDTYNFTGNVIEVVPVVVYDDNTLTLTDDYTYATNPATVQEIGEYTLTVTGAGDYAGSKSVTFFVIGGLNGDGSENNPFQITSKEDWETFATIVNTNGYDFSGKYVKLMNSIGTATEPINVMVGNYSCGFKGNFNGNGKTITVGFNHSYTLGANENEGAQGIALFNYVGNGCNIHDLNVEGTITTANKFAASIISYITAGTSSDKKYITLTNCHSSVTITSTVNGDATTGGLIAVSKAYVYPTIDHCIFDGAFVSSTGTQFCGFVGWQDANGKTTVVDAIMKADASGLTATDGNHRTYCRYNSSSAYTGTRAYYTNAIGTAQGKQAYIETEVPTTDLYGQITAVDGNTYYTVVTIGTVTNNKKYAYTGDAIEVIPTVTINQESVTFVSGTDYEVTYTFNGNPVNEVKELGNYVVTIAAKEGGKCKGACTRNISVYADKPVGLNWIALEATSATLSWTDNALSNWVVEYSLTSNFATVLGSVNASTTPSATINNLMPHTRYYARVKAVEGSFESAWSDACYFEPSSKTNIGNGTATSSYVPFSNSYSYNMSQQIYTAAEIGKSGTILSVDFYNASSVDYSRSITIYMLNTDKTQFDSTTDWFSTTADGIVKVYTGTYTFKASSWNTVAFTTPFAYDNSKNFVIIVASSQSSLNSRDFNVYNAGSSQCLSYSSSMYSWNTTKTGTLRTIKNDIRIRMGKAYTSEGWVPSAPTSPTDAISVITNMTIPNGSNVTYNSVVFSSGNLTVEAGATLTLTEGADNGEASKLIIEDGAQVIVNVPGTMATVNKTIADPAKDVADGWYTIASPVNNPTPASVTNLIQSPDENYDFYYYDEAYSMWRNHKNNAIANMTNGKGYLYWNGTGADLSYSGELNSSDVVINVTKTGSDDFAGWNLIGNPFSHNIYKGVGGAIDDVRLTEGYYTMTSNATWSAKLGYSDAIVPGQGILVKTTETFDLTIANSTAEATGSKANHDYLEFTVANSNYEDVAYALFDKGLGLDKIDHRDEQAPMLYIPQDGKNYAIATMKDGTEMFNLNFKAKTTGKFLLSYKANGEFDYLHVIDRMTGADVDMLMEGEYSFIGSSVDNENRFIVRLRYNTNITPENDEVFVYQSDDQIIVSGNGELQMFDVTGRFVMSTHVNGVQTIAKPAQNGVYILRLLDSEIKTQKIVVR